MERLTERMTGGTADCNCSACPHYKACGDEYYCDDDSECTEKIIDRLCELEDKLASGQLVELSNKPLTIDELKALKEGAWVWIVDISHNFSTYIRKSIEDIFPARSVFETYFRYSKSIYETTYTYDDYGTKWLAYKNKEQSELRGEQ